MTLHWIRRKIPGSTGQYSRSVSKGMLEQARAVILFDTLSSYTSGSDGLRFVIM